MSYLLQILAQNLQSIDEIECSAISVFNLICKIIDSTSDMEKLDFKLDLAIFCPFNFHKIINVRYSYL